MSGVLQFFRRRTLRVLSNAKSKRWAERRVNSASMIRAAAIAACWGANGDRPAAMRIFATLADFAVIAASKMSKSPSAVSSALQPVGRELGSLARALQSVAQRWRDG